jgi:predicted methyltransferase
MRRSHLLAFLIAVVAPACGGGQKPEPAPAQHAHGDEAMHRFDDPEEWAKIFDDPERDAWQHPDEVVALLEISPGMTVADLGAGTGYFLRRLSRAVGDGGKVIGTDIEPTMVAYMKGRATREALANVETVLAKPDDPTLPAGAVDRILAVDVWHHISSDGAVRTAYARKLAANLRPGGLVAIVDFTAETRRGPPAKHRIAPATVASELEAAGLKAEIADEELPDQYVVIARKP